MDIVLRENPYSPVGSMREIIPSDRCLREESVYESQFSNEAHGEKLSVKYFLITILGGFSHSYDFGLLSFISF